MFEYAGVLETTAEGEEGSELQLLASWLGHGRIPASATDLLFRLAAKVLENLRHRRAGLRLLDIKAVSGKV